MALGGGEPGLASQDLGCDGASSARLPGGHPHLGGVGRIRRSLSVASGPARPWDSAPLSLELGGPRGGRWQQACCVLKARAVQIFISAAKHRVCNFRGLTSPAGDLGVGVQQAWDMSPVFSGTL